MTARAGEVEEVLLAGEVQDIAHTPVCAEQVFEI
jgi:hypothetical protein